MIRRRGPWIAALLVLAFVAALLWLPLTAALALGALFAIVCVGLFRTPAWRNGALVLASVLIGLVGIELAVDLMTPRALNLGVVKTSMPSDWNPHDPVVGYRPR